MNLNDELHAAALRRRNAERWARLGEAIEACNIEEGFDLSSFNWDDGSKSVYFECPSGRVEGHGPDLLSALEQALGVGE